MNKEKIAELHSALQEIMFTLWDMSGEPTLMDALKTTGQRGNIKQMLRAIDGSDLEDIDTGLWDMRPSHTWTEEEEAQMVESEKANSQE